MKLRLTEYLNLIPEPDRARCMTMLKDHYPRFKKSPGSQVKHQAWEGGYLDHLEETMEFAVDLYELMSKKRKLPFTLGSVIKVLFVHDKEKPFKYVSRRRSFKNDHEKKEFILGMLKQYHIELSDDEMNAFTYIHGEGNHHNSHKRIQGELAAFVHICDTVSARIWHDYPKR